MWDWLPELFAKVWRKKRDEERRLYNRQPLPAHLGVIFIAGLAQADSILTVIRLLKPGHPLVGALMLMHFSEDQDIESR